MGWVQKVQNIYIISTVYIYIFPAFPLPLIHRLLLLAFSLFPSACPPARLWCRDWLAMSGCGGVVAGGGGVCYGDLEAQPSSPNSHFFLVCVGRFHVLTCATINSVAWGWGLSHLGFVGHASAMLSSQGNWQLSGLFCVCFTLAADSISVRVPGV